MTIDHKFGEQNPAHEECAERSESHDQGKIGEGNLGHLQRSVLDDPLRLPVQVRLRSRLGGGFSIGELCRRAGVRPSAVRYYEQRGLLPPPPRRSGRRVYGVEALQRLQALVEARRLGFTVRQLAALAGSDRDGLRAAAKLRADSLRTSIAGLSRAVDRLDALAACGCLDADACFTASMS